MAEPARIPALRPLASDVPSELELRLLVRDGEAIQALIAVEGDERTALALHALRIGLLALRQARGQIDADAVRREGDRILGDLRVRLEQHDRDLQRELRQALVEYFDPRSGKLSDRLERLVKQDGELEQLLRRQVGAKDSELSRALASSLGAQSPVLQRLDPAHSDGVVKAMARAVEESLTSQRERILAQFSLDGKDSALSRLVAELKSRHGELEQGFRKNVDAIRADFSLDVKDSPLSRLVSRVEEAQATIRREFTLDEERSALARMRAEILRVMKEQGDAATAFQQEVKASLAAMQARKVEAARSTRHGLVFEDDVWGFVERRALAAGDTPQRCGLETGAVRGSKVGDFVVVLGPDRAAAGAAIVVEAKEEASCTFDKAQFEMEAARKNRGAQVGVFVMSGRTRGATFPAFARRGQDLYVAWDAERPETDVVLEAALSVAEALCTRTATEAARSAKDLDALDRAVNEVERQVKALDDMKTWAENISRDAGKIDDKLEVVRRALERQVGELRDGLRGVRGA